MLQQTCRTRTRTNTFPYDTDLPTRWSDAGFFRSAAPGPAQAQSKRRRWTLQGDGGRSVAGRMFTEDVGQPLDRASRWRLIMEKDGIASICPHVLEEGAARPPRHGPGRSRSAGPPCARAPWRAQNKLLRTRVDPSFIHGAPGALGRYKRARPTTPRRARLYVPPAAAGKSTCSTFPLSLLDCATHVRPLHPAALACV
jgi:hypothetical protein